MMKKEMRRKWNAIAKEMAEGFKLGAEMMPMYAPGMPASMYMNYAIDPYLLDRERERAALEAEKKIVPYEGKKAEYFVKKAS